MADEKVNVNGVFSAKVKAILLKTPNQWSGEDSAAVVRSIVTSLKDKDGNPLELSPLEKDAMELASRPTHKVQVRLIKRIIEAHNAPYDSDTQSLIERVVSPMVFKGELIRDGYIKEEREGGLKDLLG